MLLLLCWFSGSITLVECCFSCNHWHKNDVVSLVCTTTVVYLSNSLTSHHPHVRVICSSLLLTSNLLFPTLLQTHAPSRCHVSHATNVRSQCPRSITWVSGACRSRASLMLLKTLGQISCLANVHETGFRPRIQTVHITCCVCWQISVSLSKWVCSGIVKCAFFQCIVASIHWYGTQNHRTVPRPLIANCYEFPHFVYCKCSIRTTNDYSQDGR